MIDVLGPEKRRRRTTQEKIAIVQQSFKPGMAVSLVARQHGVAASQLFLWRKQCQEGSLTAVAAGEQVVPASELVAAMKQIKELQRLLGKKTMENELLKEAVEYGRAKKFRCDNGEKLRVTFALDCCDREALHWAGTTGGFDSETVQDVMLGAVERRFGSELPASPVEWLTDNGSCYRANETRQFARMLGLEPKNTAVRSPESNGIAESFVKTIKRDYISIMPKPDGLTAAKNLAEAFEHYNEWHPHSALGYRSPREYLRQRASNGLWSDHAPVDSFCPHCEAFSKASGLTPPRWLWRRLRL
ncbi:MAG: transposase [Klebsiella pneumoniae]|uniref:integrase core domain-containing protein n=1 Tax=Klebsiella pneumoniae TaxID=573 RepID=UPI0007CA53AB|nr:integrase core domain-containing protein [Klebsiella pneumoniae]MDU6085111.1 transposase [Klebsiella pneumoniae]SAS32197.1 IS2 transposase [Klebsiella pneumoniae]